MAETAVVEEMGELIRPAETAEEAVMVTTVETEATVEPEVQALTHGAAVQEAVAEMAETQTKMVTESAA